MRNHVFLVLTASVLVAVLGAPAGAALSDDVLTEVGLAVIAAPDPARAYEDLDEDVQAALADWADVASVAALPAVVTPVVEGTTATRSCYDADGSVVGKNAAGVPMWTYSQRISWCTEAGVMVTGKFHMAWSETHFPGWRFYDHIKQETRLTASTFTSFVQGHFAYGVGSVDAMHEYPCNQMRAYVTTATPTTREVCSV
jgi:hypothetical protein